MKHSVLFDVKTPLPINAHIHSHPCTRTNAHTHTCAHTDIFGYFWGRATEATLIKELRIHHINVNIVMSHNVNCNLRTTAKILGMYIDTYVAKIPVQTAIPIQSGMSAFGPFGSTATLRTVATSTKVVIVSMQKAKPG